jgi:hypothetical protein
MGACRPLAGLPGDAMRWLRPLGARSGLLRRLSGPAALAVVVGLLVGGCTAAGQPGPHPWTDRPVVDLRYEVSEDLTSVEGSVGIVFTPDSATCEVVLRAWPNKPTTASTGSSLVVSTVRIAGRTAEWDDVAAGASRSAPAGTLIDVPLPDCAKPGEAVRVEADFELELGSDADERMGTSTTTDVAWFASAFPMLAWERGQGWARDPAVPVYGEMSVSEDFVLDALEVTAPADYAVLGTGHAAGTREGPDGMIVHRFTAPAVRDVAVSVGDLQVLHREVDGVRVHIAADRSVQAAEPADWLAPIAESTRDLVQLLGAFPYEDLWVTVLSSQTSGIEFPGAIQFGDVDPVERRGLVTHELAHMWFYGLVGNDQGEHPWLDESFATFAQLVADGQDRAFASVADVDLPPVGSSMSAWTEYASPNRLYYDTVYTLGGAALDEARDRVGHEAFDAALRRYLRDNAWSIATPADVQAAFSDLPEVLDVLREVGALP